MPFRISSGKLVEFLKSPLIRYGLLFLATLASMKCALRHFGAFEATIFLRQTAHASYTGAIRNLLLIYASVAIGPIALLLAIERTGTAQRQSETSERGCKFEGDDP